MPDVEDLEAAARAEEAAQNKEWSQYVAKESIFINGARAFNVGDPVPAGHVTRGVVSEDQVAKTSTKAGQAIVADLEKGSSQ